MGSGGVDPVDIRGWGGGDVVQNRESPDFRSPEDGRYVIGSQRVDGSVKNVIYQFAIPSKNNNFMRKLYPHAIINSLRFFVYY